MEAKASRDEDGPKFARNKFSKRKPSINSKLGLSGEGGAFDLIEPVLEDDESAASESTGKKRRKVKKKKPRDNSVEQNKPEVKGEAGAQRKLARDLMVQMSKEWISANLARSVGAALASSVKRSYSRHLFFSPIYHLSESPAEHALSLKEGKADSHHDKHDAYHYDEDDVKEAVNKRKGALMKKFGELESLAKEK